MPQWRLTLFLVVATALALVGLFALGPEPGSVAVEPELASEFSSASKPEVSMVAEDGGARQSEVVITEAPALPRATDVVPAASGLDAPHAGSPAAPRLRKASHPREVHVCFCSDDEDLRPLAAAINSTIASSKETAGLVIHFVTTAQKAASFERDLRAVLALRGAVLQVHHHEGLQEHIKSQVAFRKSSSARKALASPFNFAPFYLEQFLSKSGDGGVPAKLIYLDTDVVVRSDVRQLLDLDMQGRAAAAVEDCSQRFETYIDFKELEKLGFEREGLDPKACVFNRGVFVVDVRKWRELKIREDIELWMKRYRESTKDLYRFGMSQPPWLLALQGRYMPLGAEWNCRGLGREFLSNDELKETKKATGLHDKDLKAIGMKFLGGTGNNKPYLAPCASGAKLLHFNGALKPWKKVKKGQTRPLCACPPSAVAAASVKPVEGLHGGFLPCADLWGEYLSPAAAKVLQDSRE